MIKPLSEFAIIPDQHGKAVLHHPLVKPLISKGHLLYSSNPIQIRMLSAEPRQCLQLDALIHITDKWPVAKSLVCLMKASQPVEIGRRAEHEDILVLLHVLMHQRLDLTFSLGLLIIS